MRKKRQETACLLVITLANLIFCLNVYAQDDCTPIRFAAGGDSVVITGMAPAEDVICYSLTTLAGQTATLELFESTNVVFGIDGLVDARDRYTFTTEHMTYRIRVSQLMRALSDQPFRLRVSVTVRSDDPTL